MASAPEVPPGRPVGTEARGLELFESLRWPAGPVCPHCGAAGRAHFLTPADGVSRVTRVGGRSERRLWKCGACRRQFSVLTGTVFHGSRVGAATWLAGLELLTATDQDLSAGLARTLADRRGVDPETAAHVLSRLREALVAAGR